MPGLKILKCMVLAGCALGVAAGPVAAASFCGGAGDMAAFRTAAVQQELMAAALSCRNVEAYNRFVLAYRPELQRADADLKAHFAGRGGETRYDDFRARLAALSSQNGGAGGPVYCRNVAAAFEIALANHPALSSFAADGRLMQALSGQTICTPLRPIPVMTAARVKPVPVKLNLVKVAIMLPQLKAAPVRSAPVRMPPVSTPRQVAMEIPPPPLRNVPSGDARPAPNVYAYHHQEPDDAELPLPPRPERPRLQQSARDDDGYYDPPRYPYGWEPRAYRWAPPPPPDNYYYGR